MKLAALFVVMLLLAGCAGSPDETPTDHGGDEPGSDGNATAAPTPTTTPASSGDAGNGDAGNETSSGNVTEPPTGNATGNVTGNGTGNATTNETVEPNNVATEPWSGSCGLAFMGAMNGGTTALMNSVLKCSVAPDPPIGYTALAVTSTDGSDAFVGNALKLTIKDAAGTTIGIIDTGSNMAGSGTFALDDAHDLSLVSITLSGTGAGSGKATIAWDFVV